MMTSFSAVSMRLTLSILVCLFNITFVTGVYKRWKTTTDFDNPSNWNLGHLPCPADRIMFPASSPVVAINQDWTLKDMTLPNDGIFVLGSNLNLVFNDQPTLTPECNISRDISYNFTTAAHWLDPANWCLPLAYFDPTCFEGLLQLHTEMVPCVTDDVLFPGLLNPRHRSSFYVDLDLGANVEIGTLKIGSQFYSTDTFNEYIATDIGRMEFIQEQGSSPSILNMTTRLCGDMAGCYCGTDQYPWKEKICDYVGSCPPAYCHTPIQPTGHCCHICGAKMELVINTTVFSKLHFQNLINTDFIENKDKSYGDVRFAFTRLANGNSQLTFVDSSSGSTSTRLALEIKQLVEQDMIGERRYGVRSIMNYEVSGSPESTPSSASSTTQISSEAPPIKPSKGPVDTASTPKGTIPASQPVTKVDSSSTPAGVTIKSPASQSSDMESGTIIAIVFIVICVILVASIALICYIYRRSSASYGMSDSIEFEEHKGASGKGAVAFSRGLDNPLYDDEGGIVNVQLEMMSPPTTSAVSNVTTSNGKKTLKKKLSKGFDNPLFFDSKNETVETVGSNGNQKQMFANPMFDEDFQQDGGPSADNFM